jgi:hypothetical protein
MQPYQPPQQYVPRPQRTQSEYTFKCDCGIEFGSHAPEGICPGCGREFGIDPPHGSLAIMTPEPPRARPQYESTKEGTKALDDQAERLTELAFQIMPAKAIPCPLCDGRGERMVVWFDSTGMRTCVDCEGTGFRSDTSERIKIEAQFRAFLAAL